MNKRKIDMFNFYQKLCDAIGAASDAGAGADDTTTFGLVDPAPDGERKELAAVLAACRRQKAYYGQEMEAICLSVMQAIRASSDDPSGKPVYRGGLSGGRTGRRAGRRCCFRVPPGGARME